MRQNGRKKGTPNLTPEQRAEIANWHDKVMALGQARAYLRKARIEWRAKKDALGTIKQLAKKYGVCHGTIHTAAFRKHVK